ncbi:UNVERIFIED_CONTAM: hypothetical protein HDU68_007562 [Siphonaria sp. JEL0065]|nr:hypothetical protein HDU68_007562 [Siphonaria sp. JEL0065]
MSIAYFPPEMIEDVLLQLPIDSNLTAIASASKSQFAPFLLGNASFAKRHFRHKVSSSDTIWEYMDEANIKFDGWLSLPFNYMLAIYADILTAPVRIIDRKGVKTVGKDATKNIVHPRRWENLPSHTALRIMKTLVRDPNDPLDTSCNDNRPFRWAAYQNQVQVVDFLLTECPNIDPNVFNHQVIGKVAEYGYAEMVKRLLQDSRIDPTSDDNYAIQCACEDGRVDVVRVLLEDGRADPSSDQNYAICYASQKGRTDVVKMLLDDPRVDPSASDNFSIQRASWRGHTDIVKLLLSDSRVNPTASNNVPLRVASEYGHFGVVKVLLADHRVDPTAKDNEAFRKAVENWHFQVVDLLLKDGRVDVSLETGSPMVHLCIQRALKWNLGPDASIKEIHQVSDMKALLLTYSRIRKLNIPL